MKGSFCVIRLEVKTTVDANASPQKFIEVKGHSSYKTGWAVNYKGYKETSFIL